MEKPLQAGEIVADRYKLTNLVGRGALGSVYRAEDTKTAVICYIKVFGKDRVKSFPEYTDHLRLLSSRLSLSPLFLHVFDVGETEDYFYIVQEYLESADSLDHIIRDDAPLSPYRALAIMREVARALDLLHSASVVHADIKPGNILISSETRLGASSAVEAFTTVSLIDFGMAQRIEPDKGGLSGGNSPLYGAPTSEGTNRPLHRYLCAWGHCC